METKMILSVVFVAALFVGSEVSSATYYSTHGVRAPGVSASLVRSRLQTRQTPGAAQNPAVNPYQQQQQQDPAYPAGSVIYYPAHSSNPLVAQQHQQFRLQTPQGVQSTQPLAQQFLQQQQQLYQQQQQQLYQQQQQPEVVQYQQQQDPNAQTPGGVRYIFTTGAQLPAQLAQSRPEPAAEPAAAPTRNAVPLGASYSPATAVSSIKFSNPYANYSYG